MPEPEELVHRLQNDLVDRLKVKCRIDILGNATQDFDLCRSSSKLLSKITVAPLGCHELLDEPCHVQQLERLYTIDIRGTQFEDAFHSGNRSNGLDPHVHLVKDRALGFGMIVMNVQNPLAVRDEVVQ